MSDLNTELSRRAVVLASAGAAAMTLLPAATFAQSNHITQTSNQNEQRIRGGGQVGTSHIVMARDLFEQALDLLCLPLRAESFVGPAPDGPRRVPLRRVARAAVIAEQGRIIGQRP